MAQWVRLFGVGEGPEEGKVMEAEVEGVSICVAKTGGELCAVDNWCPHRRGPLGQGWMEGNAVVCPWHSWAFDVRTGIADYPEKERVDVFPLKVEGDDVLVDIS
ncbi:Rieske (2Fe-2S) protein [Granulicella tundricola]|uniref:Rieske (2Fe-2S) iron-sulfur domain protein n=1 Tax=Granulicella tundricola (strain ATCC BAA-1859 / DSM 23138 / MP5ACTX9) TaxID=1198114 RepID=E8WXK9_GRATM|nr:Rieske 2Fe-2S domain-containing protein [Granulicella tundricola]ADW68625.1 Rieske (2Fe-2S) iron-sulfur domain protein [Granulicella tundricola MP5ACTX9]